MATLVHHINHPAAKDFIPLERKKTCSCDRGERSGYIEVTPAILNFARSISLPSDATSQTAYSSIINFIWNKHRAFANGPTLKKIFHESFADKTTTPSIEETEELMLRALHGTLTEWERVVTEDLRKQVQVELSSLEQKYHANEERLSPIAQRLWAFPEYDPITQKFSPKMLEYIMSLPNINDLILVDQYHVVQERLIVLDAMLKEVSGELECNRIRHALGHPLTVQTWSQNTELQLTPEAHIDGAYKLYERNWDYPFSLSADEILRYKIGSGCTHAAIAFMSLAKALGFCDVRLVSMIINKKYNRKNCSGGKNTPPVISMYVDSHKVVLARMGDRWVLINTTRSTMQTIDTTADGKPINPDTLVGKDVTFPRSNAAGRNNGLMFRVRAMGSSENDYLMNCCLENDARTLFTGRYDDDEISCQAYPLPEHQPSTK